MKYIMFVLFIILSQNVMAGCRNFTPEQFAILQTAYGYGKDYDLGYTLAAIAMRESFVGKYVIKVNSKDGKYGSYGITHINLETAMWLENMNNPWKARAKLVPKLMVDDNYALNLALRKLETNKNLGWNDMVRSYNGSVRSPATLDYLNGIKYNINLLKKCNVIWE